MYGSSRRGFLCLWPGCEHGLALGVLPGPTRPAGDGDGGAAEEPGDVPGFCPADYLVVEFFLEGLGRLHQGVGVGILGLEVLDDLGIKPFVEPAVIVDPGLAVDGQLLADLLGQKRLWGLLGECRDTRNDDEQRGQDSRFGLEKAGG